MKRSDLINAAKFTVEHKGNLAFFIGVLCSQANMKANDQEFDELFQKILDNEN